MANRFNAKRWWRALKRYLGWRLRHPLAPYEGYYVDVVMRKVRKGGHPAIGPRARPVREQSELLDYLVSHGLQPDDVAVDYGCGSLRLGQAVIDYLAPGKYWGIDITHEFYELGLQAMDAEFIRAKRPNLGVIQPDVLARVRADKPRFVASWHVCSKVPEARLDAYLGNIVSLLTESSTALIHFPESAERRQLSGLAWASPRRLLESTVHRHAPEAEVSFQPLVEGEIDGIRQTVMVIRV